MNGMRYVCLSYKTRTVHFGIFRLFYECISSTITIRKLYGQYCSGTGTGTVAWEYYFNFHFISYTCMCMSVRTYSGYTETMIDFAREKFVRNCICIFFKEGYVPYSPITSNIQVRYCHLCNYHIVVCCMILLDELNQYSIRFE